MGPIMSKMIILDYERLSVVDIVKRRLQHLQLLSHIELKVNGIFF